MTQLFWLIIIVMTGSAIAFVIFPLLRKNLSIPQTQRNTLNIAIYKERLAELEQETLSPEELAQAKQELEKTLAQELELPSPNTTQESSHKANIYASLVMTIVIPIVAISGYLYVGKPELVDAVTLAPQNADMSPDVEMLVKKLASRLQQQPDDVTGWQVLARTYVALERYEEAVQAYEHLLSLVGEDPALLTNFAEALAMVNKGQWQGRPNELLETALSLDANAEKTLWLSGVAAVQQMDYPLALRHWQHLLTQISPEETEKRQLLQKQITRLQTLPQAETSPIPQAETINLNIKVSLNTDLQNLVESTDTVFIYARALEGPPMPLAVVKKTVADLPAVVTLNQSNAVVATANLANFKEVTLIARVAKNGQVTAQSGDLQGQITPISVYERNQVEIIINEIIP